MSQKSNPLSLRLQKNNQNFSSPWFADFFLTENYHHESMIDKYITLLSKEMKLSKTFFSIKNGYRKSTVLLVLQDTRAHQKEKQLSFKLRKSSSLLSVSLREKKGNGKRSDFYKPVSLPFSQNVKSDTINKEITPNVKERINQSFISHFSPFFFKEKREKKIELSLYLRKQIRHEFLKSKGDFSLSVPLLSPKGNGKKGITLSSWCFSFFKNQKVIESDLQNQVKKAWQSENNRLIKKNSCFSFCERIVKQESLPKIDLPLRCTTFECVDTKPISPFLFKENDFLLQKEKKKLLCSRLRLEKNTKNGNGKKKESIFDVTNLKDSLPLAKQDYRNDLQTIPPLTSQERKLFYEELSRNEGSRCANKRSFPFFRNGILPPSFAATTYFQPIRFINDAQSVISLLDGIVDLLEKRVSFRGIKSKLFQNLSRSSLIKGVRISCSGRLGGRSKKAQKAKVQSDSWGEMSLNTFSSPIVFAKKSAYTSYGKVGIKLWLSFQSKSVCL